MVQAQEQFPANAKPVLAIIEASPLEGLGCAAIFEHEFTRTQRYQVLPLWHVQQRVGLGGKLPLPGQWPQLFQQLQSDFLIFNDLQIQGTTLTLATVIVQRSPQPTIIFADYIRGGAGDGVALCESMARRYLGTDKSETLKSPALAASLSFIIPGMGHYYLGKPINYLLGSLFLGGYATLAYLALTNETLPISREQWGALLLGLSLTDTLTAYFFANQQVQAEMNSYE